MSSVLTPDIVYPESDGQPIAENTLQFRWIVTIYGGLDAQYRDDPNVFVAGDLLWYPEEGHPEIRQAPDVMVVFGRPKGDRGSYLQWKEDHLPPQVVFEILSPGNRMGEMSRKFVFYEKYGVEEYYLYDPDRALLNGFLRSNDQLEPIASMCDWVSPRLRIRFEWKDGELTLYHATGRRFASFQEVIAQRDQAEREKRALETERRKTEQRLQQAEARQKHAEAEAEKLRAQLRALGIEPNP